jgi:hypothetical protein
MILPTSNENGVEKSVIRRRRGTRKRGSIGRGKLLIKAGKSWSYCLWRLEFHCRKKARLWKDFWNKRPLKGENLKGTVGNTMLTV